MNFLRKKLESVLEGLEGVTQHPSNRTKDRKIMGSVWDFGAIARKKEREHYVCNEHPAKMRPSLAGAILQVYGESPVLDPMCGIGTTCAEASLLGMKSVGVEYEKKFVNQARKNILHLKKISTGKVLGKASIVKGDARFLSRLFPGNASSIVFSPPYGEANRGGGIAEKGYEGKHGRDKGLKDRCDRPLSNDKNNVGNLKYGPTYLDEMFKVYSECFKMLKPGKFMTVVVKDIRRNGNTVPLGADTIKLCQMAGFDCFEIIVNKLYFPSFWMLHHAIKNQTNGNPQTLRTHEYVLVFRKPLGVKACQTK